MYCPTCGKELYDNGECRFNCPFCGAKVVGSGSETEEEREETLESIAFTLNHIWLQDHQARVTAYPQLNEEDQQMLLKTDDIHPPKSVISVHFFCLTCLMALQI